MRVATVMVAAVLLSCSSKNDSEPARPPMTQRQHDSVIGASGIPGAKGITGALKATDAAAARQSVADSIQP